MANGTQTPGHYSWWNHPLADDNRYDLQTAALQTTPGTFVRPNNTTLQAATNPLQPTSSAEPGRSYNQLESAVGAAGYPGTMVVYAACPQADRLPPPPLICLAP